MNAVCAQSAVDKNKVVDYFQNQQFEEAISYLNPALEKDSANLQILSWLGYASYMNDNVINAKQYYQKLLALDSGSISANQYLALININSNPVLAQVYTRRLIQLQPGKAAHYRSMGSLFKKLNQKDSAFLYYQAAYEKSPADYKNIAGLTDLLIEKKNYIAADSILDQALAKDSTNITYLKLRIRSASEAKDFLRAVPLGEQLKRTGDISQTAFTQLAIAYYNTNRYQNCVDICAYMLTNELESESIFYYEAKALAKLKRFTESNELLQICISKALSKTAELYYYNLGENDEALKQFGNAVHQYDTAFYLFKNPLMKYYSGRIYTNNLKNEHMAEQYYRQYLALAKPQTADEQKAYDYIRKTYGRKKK